jgi:hypothetical protein
MFLKISFWPQMTLYLETFSINFYTESYQQTCFWLRLGLKNRISVISVIMPQTRFKTFYILPLSGALCKNQDYVNFDLFVSCFVMVSVNTCNTFIFSVFSLLFNLHFKASIVDKWLGQNTFIMGHNHIYCIM